MARSRTSAVCQPHHDGIALHWSPHRGIAAVGEARRRVEARGGGEEPLAQGGAPGVLDVADDLVVEQRPELDEVAVGVDDRVVDPATHPGRFGRCGRHRCSSRPSAHYDAA